MHCTDPFQLLPQQAGALKKNSSPTKSKAKFKIVVRHTKVMTVDAAAAFVLPLPNLEARRADALTGAHAAAHSFQHLRYQPLQAYSVGCTSGLALSSLGLAASARQTRRRTRLARLAASRSFAPPRTTRPDDGRRGCYVCHRVPSELLGMLHFGYHYSSYVLVVCGHEETVWKQSRCPASLCEALPTNSRLCGETV